MRLKVNFPMITYKALFTPRVVTSELMKKVLITA